jgi:hypothetical protein
MPRKESGARGSAIGEHALRLYMAALAIAADRVLSVTVKLYRQKLLDYRQVRLGLRLASALSREALRLLRAGRARRRDQ